MATGNLRLEVQMVAIPWRPPPVVTDTAPGVLEALLPGMAKRK